MAWLVLFCFGMSWAHLGPVSAGSFSEQRPVIEFKGCGKIPRDKEIEEI